MVLVLPLALSAQNQQPKAVKKDSAHTVAEVIINAEKKLQVNHLDIQGLKAPMSINIINDKILEEQNITKMDEAVRNIPGINSVNQYGAFQFFNIRGFDNFVILNDGVRDERHNISTSAPSTNLANVERIEFLKGPSGDIFGHSALGGIINIVRKKPTSAFKGNAGLTVGSFNTYNYVFGAGGALSDKLRYRFDVGINKTDGWRNVAETTRNFALTLQYLPDSKNSVELYIQHNNDKYDTDSGIPADNEGNVVQGLDYLQNYGNSNDFTTNKKTEFQLKFIHKFSPTTKLTNVLSYYDDNINYLVDEVLFYNPENQTISMYNGPYHFNHFTKPLSNQLNLNFTFKTGNIEHQAIVGNTASYLNRKTIYREVTTSASNIEIPVQNYYTMGERILGDPQAVAKIDELMIGTYFSDWIRFSNKFQVLAGLRYNLFSGKYLPRQSTADPEIYTRDQFNNFTYRFGFSYQPVSNFLNLYATISNFFKPTRSYNERTKEAFIPEKGYQTEIGAKISKSNKYNISLAGFYIEKGNLIVGHNILSQVGGASSIGFEIDADWSPVPELYIKAGFAYTNAKFISKGQSEEDSSIIGNFTPWTPLNSFNSWISYEFKNSLKGLGFGFGVNFVDKTYQNQFNTQTLPSYVLTNGAIHYQMKNGIRLGLNFENIFNSLYFRGALSSNDLYSNDPANEVYQSAMQVYPGRERNFKASINYSF